MRLRERGLEQGARAIGTEAPGALGELDAARVPDHAREGLEKRGLSCADHARYKIDRRRGEREGEVDDGGNALIGDTEVGKTKLKHGLRVFDHGVSHDRHFALRRKSVESRFRLVRWYRFRCG